MKGRRGLGGEETMDRLLRDFLALVGHVWWEDDEAENVFPE